jgi:hypothetical protein
VVESKRSTPASSNPTIRAIISMLGAAFACGVMPADAVARYREKAPAALNRVRPYPAKN